MNAHNFSHNQSQFAKLTLDPSQFSGRGGALAPSLYLSGNLEINPLARIQGPTRGVLLQELSGTAVVDHAGGFQLHVVPQPIQRTVLAGSTPLPAELPAVVADAAARQPAMTSRCIAARPALGADGGPHPRIDC